MLPLGTLLLVLAAPMQKPANSAAPAPAQAPAQAPASQPATKGFGVEEKPAEVLEKAPGLNERYALLIGISKYANASLSLNFAAADAKSLQAVLLDPEIGAYKPENVRLLVDDQATRKNVVSALSTWLGNRVKPEDSVIIFYSGHGALGGGNEAYWVTYDADVDDLGSSAISNKEISTLIGNLSAKRKITFIDSCYSEATAKKYRAVVPTNLFDQFKGKGVVTITASSGQEKSVEVGGHGAFTYHLLDALRGKADTNNNGVVELDEVWNYLNEKVQKTAADAGNKQTPVLMAERMEHGFPVTLNPERAALSVMAPLKAMYADGAITLDEVAEAERVLVKREGSSELRNLYKGLADKGLSIPYFRQLRSVLTSGGSVNAAALAAAAGAPGGAPGGVPGAPAGGPSGVELESFKVAETTATMEGWIRFLQQFPQGYLGAAAMTKINEIDRKKLEEAAYELAKRADGEKTWEQFLALYPNTSHTSEAERRYRELKQNRESETTAFRLAESKNSESVWQRFLQDYPLGPLAIVAEDRLELLRKLAKEKEDNTYALAVRNNTLESWDLYLKEYPTGRFADDAKAKRADVIKKMEEERERKAHADLFAAARQADSIEGWSAYLAKYPNGEYAPLASRRIDQINWFNFSDVIRLPGGAFNMGNSKGPKDEQPQHRVEVDPFLMGRSEITNAQYLKFVAETKHNAPPDPTFIRNYFQAHPDLPVVNVTYDDAVAFCKWLSQKTGLVVRLPTEAEWEYAATGGKDGMTYPWGAEKPNQKARFKGNAPKGAATVSAKVYPPNELGLYNMAGNVAEWVFDFYDPKGYFGVTAKRNPTGVQGGGERVVRGGSWKSNENDLKCSHRGKQIPGAGSEETGFRIVIEFPKRSS